LTRRHLKLGLLGHDGDFVMTIGSQKSGNRAKMAGRTDNNPSPDLAVYNPMITRSFEGFQ
jgi:hypothetical protein